MARPIRARMAPPNRSRQRSEQGKPTVGSSHSKGALAIRSPSRRLFGERLARLRARDALATAGKMPPLLSRERGNKKNQKKRDSIFAYSADLSASTGSTSQELSRLPRA